MTSFQGWSNATDIDKMKKRHHLTWDTYWVAIGWHIIQIIFLFQDQNTTVYYDRDLTTVTTDQDLAVVVSINTHTHEINSIVTD